MANDIYCQKDLITTNSLGISLQVGTHFTRLGLSGEANIIKDHYQGVTHLFVYYNFKNLGPKIKGFELQCDIGGIYAWNENRNFKTLNSIETIQNKTGYKNALGYSYVIYLGKLSQVSGRLFYSLENWEIYHENDVLGSLKSDKYRTAAFGIYTIQENQKIGVKTVLWTGNSNSKKANKVFDTSFSRFGYIDMSEVEYGKYSHGILAFEYSKFNNYNQNLNFAAGIDSERIRNIFQNKIAHDSWFLPEKLVVRKNYHIPMIAEDGSPFYTSKINE